jgi:hypothetical protein
MQDRICQIDETLLHRTAGPYNGVRNVGGAALAGRPCPLLQKTGPAGIPAFGRQPGTHVVTRGGAP